MIVWISAKGTGRPHDQRYEVLAVTEETNELIVRSCGDGRVLLADAKWVTSFELTDEFRISVTAGTAYRSSPRPVTEDTPAGTWLGDVDPADLNNDTPPGRLAGGKADRQAPGRPPRRRPAAGHLHLTRETVR